MSLGYLEQPNKAPMYEMKATRNIKASNTKPPQRTQNIKIVTINKKISSITIKMLWIALTQNQ